jgi:hypothetical protein
MSNLCVFFNTKVEDSGIFAGIGDLGLAPFRYLFNGKTIRVELHDDKQIEIHHVASFHKLGSDNGSYTTRGLRSSSTGMIKTICAVVLLIPGFFLALSKVFAYVFSDVREKHSLVKEHLTPINRHIGNVFNPIQNIAELEEQLSREFNSDLKHRPTNALIIHGNGNLEINEDPGILRFNPMKLVLEGAAIVHRPSLFGRLDNKMHATGGWETKGVRKVTALTRPDASLVVTHRVCSIEEALQTTAPWRDSCKRYHMVFMLARPNCETVATTAGLLQIPEGISEFNAWT